MKTFKSVYLYALFIVGVIRFTQLCLYEFTFTGFFFFFGIIVFHFWCAKCKALVARYNCMLQLQRRRGK